jgi:hypothetical protein
MQHAPASLPFTDADNLRHNQLGRLAPAQKKALNLWAGCWVTLFLGGMLTLFGCVTFAALLGVLLGEGAAPDSIYGLLCMSALVLGGAAVGARPLYRLIRTGLDAEAEKVLVAQGQVVWHKDTYRADFPERPTLASNAVELAPGPYRFYYLPHSGRIVGAEALFEPQQALNRMRDILAAALKFDSPTLMENRAGRLSEAQRATLQRGVFNYGAGLLIALLIGGGMSWMALTGANDNTVSAWLLGGLTLLFMAIFGLGASNYYRDLGEGAALQTEGFGTKYIVSSRNSRRYYISVGAARFSVEYKAYQAFVPGRYTFYYTAHSKTLLSLEPCRV